MIYFEGILWMIYLEGIAWMAYFGRYYLTCIEGLCRCPRFDANISPVLRVCVDARGLMLISHLY